MAFHPFLALLAATAQAQDPKKPELASATPGCAHAQIEGKDRRSAPETFSAVLGQTRDHYNKFCGLPNQSVPATVALFQQSYSDCGSSAERAQVTELGRDIDRRRTELCRSLRETLTRADDFCKSYRRQEIMIRLTVIETMSPKAADAWSADLRLKFLDERLKNATKALEKVQATAKDDADFAENNPKSAPPGLARSSRALGERGKQLAREAAAAQELERGKSPGIQSRLQKCVDKVPCIRSTTGVKLREESVRNKNAQSVCNVAANQAKSLTGVAEIFEQDAARLRRGFLASAEAAKRTVRTIDDSHQRVGAYLARLHSLGEVKKPDFKDPANPKPDISGLEKVGSLKPTFYWVAEEKDIGEDRTHTVMGTDGKPLAKVSERFFTDELSMEGTGKLLDGRTVNAAGKKNGEQTFEVLGADTPYGLGQSPKYPLDPYHSVAVDPNKIPIGSDLYMPALYGMPYVDQDGVARLHDGRLKAVDVGDLINGDRVDVFTGVGDNSYYFAQNGVLSMQATDLYFLSKPTQK